MQICTKCGKKLEGFGSGITHRILKEPSLNIFMSDADIDKTDEQLRLVPVTLCNYCVVEFVIHLLDSKLVSESQLEQFAAPNFTPHQWRT